MNYLRTLLFFVLPLVCFGQSESNPYLKAIEDVKSHYNSRSYDSLYTMFADSMKAAITVDILKQQLDGLHEQAGIIEDVSFLEEVDGGKIYKVDHEAMPLEYSIFLNSDSEIIGLRPQPFRSREIQVIERNTTKIGLPFEGEWNVFWGGTNAFKNYHVNHINQKYAYDILIIKDGSSYIEDPKLNESYYAFGKEIIAPCDAKVVQVIRGVPDNVPGELNPKQATGNTVVLETENKEYLLFAHLKLESIVVAEGQEVNKGDLLGLCGNSGNSTEAHLHLSLQNQTNMFGATGGKLYFDKILVNGEIKEDHLPERGDVVKNSDN